MKPTTATTTTATAATAATPPERNSSWKKTRQADIMAFPYWGSKKNCRLCNKPNPHLKLRVCLECKPGTHFPPAGTPKTNVFSDGLRMCSRCYGGLELRSFDTKASGEYYAYCKKCAFHANEKKRLAKLGDRQSSIDSVGSVEKTTARRKASHIARQKLLAVKKSKKTTKAHQRKVMKKKKTVMVPSQEVSAFVTPAMPATPVTTPTLPVELRRSSPSYPCSPSSASVATVTDGEDSESEVMDFGGPSSPVKLPISVRSNFPSVPVPQPVASLVTPASIFSSSNPSTRPAVLPTPLEFPTDFFTLFESRVTSPEPVAQPLMSTGMPMSVHRDDFLRGIPSSADPLGFPDELFDCLL